MSILNLFRLLPSFRGKYKLASLLVGAALNKKNICRFIGRYNLCYTIPNTIEPVGKELLINGIYEKKTVSLLLSLVDDKAIFFDVGANIGSILLPVSKLKNTAIHAFEPSKFAFKFLEENVMQNMLSNVRLNNNVVHSIDNKDFQFFEAEEKYGNSSLSATFINQPHHTIKSVSLDEYCERYQISFIDVLKIDVQGYEIEVLKGASGLLDRNAIGTIIFEMEAWAELQAGYDIGASQSYLTQKGYELFDLNRKKIKEIIKVGSAMFLAVAPDTRATA